MLVAVCSMVLATDTMSCTTPLRKSMFQVAGSSGRVWISLFNTFGDSLQCRGLHAGIHLDCAQLASPPVNDVSSTNKELGGGGQSVIVSWQRDAKGTFVGLQDLQQPTDS